MDNTESLILKTPPVYALESDEAFNALNDQEKKYLHYVCDVGWVGAVIDALQTSPESAGLVLLAHKIFSEETIESLTEAARNSSISDQSIKSILEYFASVYGNIGNYYSFGDSKFIPSCPQIDFISFVKCAKAYKTTNVSSILNYVIDQLYSTDRRRHRLAFNPDGITSFYSSNFLQSDADLVQKYVKFAKLETTNTRVFKVIDKENITNYYIMIASATEKLFEVKDWPDCPKNCKLFIKHGDYSAVMKLLVQACQDCETASLNGNEKEMWRLYGKSFDTGSVDDHKDASRAWIKDKGPVVENYIGFIETYRDPLGVRAEYESFAAIVNKKKSEKFQVLVDRSKEFISKLPWPKEYEKDLFLKPDFTSLDIVSFASNGIPVGINIPNYDDIRQSEGFKNVSLGNVLEARFKDPQVTFVSATDRELYLKYCGSAFNVQVGLHELLGHGSGKLFIQDHEGNFNFDKDKVKDIVNGGPIKKWYEPGETWDGKFSSISSAYEECRAECVGVYLCSLPEVLAVFGHSNETEGGDVAYVNWLLMCRSAIVSTEFFSPGQGDNPGAWRQAHCNARYVILRVLMEADPSMVKIDVFNGEDGKPDLNVCVDREKVLTKGREAIGRFLNFLQYYKSTGNSEEGVKFFQRYSQLTKEHLDFRKIVLSRKRPRNVYVQPVTSAINGKIELKNFPATIEGVIESFIYRYGPESKWGKLVIEALEQCWENEKVHHTDIPL